ncbi:hypothetical protein AIGOOFII_3755 [Methylobacterium marchantiae]|nr:hypothetical protein AIGOOFII_3755 [Methylobacterium marchantiae]
METGFLGWITAGGGVHLILLAASLVIGLIAVTRP